MDISTQPWFVWLEKQGWIRPIFGVIFRIDFHLGRLIDRFKKKKPMLKIGIVGDLSLQDPARLAKAMDAAFFASDFVVCMGDMHPGYDVVKKYAAMTKPVYAVCGNHDAEWDTKLGWVRQWRHDTELAVLIGIDNSQDTFSAKDIAQLNDLPADKPIFVFVHKPLSAIVLPDGSESSHCMGEGAPNVQAHAMQTVVSAHSDLLLVHGHYHGWALMKTAYADCLIEGRGGAAPEIGWTQIIVTPDGFTIHKFDLPN